MSKRTFLKKEVLEKREEKCLASFQINQQQDRSGYESPMEFTQGHPGLNSTKYESPIEFTQGHPG